MPKTNCRAAGWLLGCTAALLLPACGITPDWTPRKRVAAECPHDSLHYCTHSNWGTRCGCMSKQEMEKVLRSHQYAAMRPIAEAAISGNRH